MPKQGVHSVGVARQYCGRLGKVANCQAGMFVAYAGAGGATRVHRRLFLTQSQLALGLLTKPVTDGLLPVRWVVFDEGYGRSVSWTGCWPWAAWRRHRSTRGSGRHDRRPLRPAPDRPGDADHGGAAAHCLLAETTEDMASAIARAWTEPDAIASRMALG